MLATTTKENSQFYQLIMNDAKCTTLQPVMRFKTVHAPCATMFLVWTMEQVPIS